MSEEMQAVMSALTFDKRMWTYADVALFLQRNPNTVANSISKRPDFPKAIRFDSHPLFNPEEVKAWALSQKEKN